MSEMLSIQKNLKSTQSGERTNDLEDIDVLRAEKKHSQLNIKYETLHLKNQC